MNKPYKVTKRLSDINNKIHDEAQNKTKIVHSDYLKKATLSHVKLDSSDNEPLRLPKEGSDSDFKLVNPRLKQVYKQLAA